MGGVQTARSGTGQAAPRRRLPVGHGADAWSIGGGWADLVGLVDEAFTTLREATR
ncbi:MAG TPA: hypothetical protein VHH52_05140 [Pseudonocardiaceae bacterium]|nr:hypothetical protein [Pseudonocardiaceae bacterium]